MDRSRVSPSLDASTTTQVKRLRNNDTVIEPVIPVKKRGVIVHSGEASSSQAEASFELEKLDVRPRKIRRKSTEHPPSPLQRVPTVIDLTLSDSDDDPPPPPPPKKKHVKKEKTKPVKKSKKWDFLHLDSSDSFTDEDDDGVRKYALQSSQKDDEEDQLDEAANEDPEEEDELDSALDDKTVRYQDDSGLDDWVDYDMGPSPSPPPADNASERATSEGPVAAASEEPDTGSDNGFDIGFDIGSDIRSELESDIGSINEREPAIEHEPATEQEPVIEEEPITEEDTVDEQEPVKNNTVDPIDRSVEVQPSTRSICEEPITKPTELIYDDERESAPPSIESTSSQASNEPKTPKITSPDLSDKQLPANDIDTPSSTYDHTISEQSSILNASGQDDDDDDDDDDEFHSTREDKSHSSDDDFVTAQQNMSSTTEENAMGADYKRLPRQALKTGYVYDPIMSLHAQLDQEDDEPHPEDPRRIYSIYKCMEENGLLKNCTRIPVRKATKKEILSTHDPRYLQLLEQTQDMSQKDLEKEARKYNSIYMNAHSNESARFSAGGVIEACSAVATDKVQNAFAIVRPPGHHAEFDTAMGFCLINNVAIAARYCKEHFPFVERILILDWDIHFGKDNCKKHYHHETHHDLVASAGNGTQQLTSRDADILYMSLHRYEKGTFYPQDTHGKASYVGRRSGKGRTVNIPWPNAGMTDGDYLYAFREIVMPIAMEFAPSLVIVSAGFDAAAGDHIGECFVTPAGYGQMTHMLKSLANGRIVLALEGGYNLDSIAKSAHACMSVLMGEAPEIPTLLTPSPECVQTIRKVKATQMEYWDCLKY